MNARATVIIPTYGEAPFSRWAVKSVQRQTVSDLEICIICDGSPPGMTEFFRDMSKEDRRIRVFVYPKSPRTGEPYRDEVIRQTTGKIICYCSHDDLWLPRHVEAMENTLLSCGFTHSIHTYINVPHSSEKEMGQLLFDFGDRDAPARMLGFDNYFGLTFGAHTRAFYNRLDEGWVTTPRPPFPTDLYMWQKFISLDARECRTTRLVTAICFPKPKRAGWSPEKREEEIKRYYEKMQSPDFMQQLDHLVLDNYIALAEKNREAAGSLGQIIREKDKELKQLSDVQQNLEEQNAQANRRINELESRLAKNPAARVVLSIGEGTFFLKIKGRIKKRLQKTNFDV